MNDMKSKRQIENDKAYADVGPLEKMSVLNMMNTPAGKTATRLIVAKFRVDESNSNEDYSGGRSVREVVIGFGYGSRESFKHMLDAANKFPPTANYGKDQEHRDNYSFGEGNWLGDHRYSGWIVKSVSFDQVATEFEYEFFEAPRKASDPVPKHVTPKVEEFDAELVALARAIERQNHEQCPMDAHWGKKVILKKGRKYVNIDYNGSGYYMVDMETRRVYGISGYGVINRRRPYGSVTEFLAKFAPEQVEPSVTDLYSANV